MRDFAERFAVLLAAAPSPRNVLSLFVALATDRVAEIEQHAAETLAGVQPGAFKPVPVPPEILAEALRTFDAKEVADAIREIRAGGGRKLEDVLPELKRTAAGQSDAPQS